MHDHLDHSTTKTITTGTTARQKRPPCTYTVWDAAGTRRPASTGGASRTSSDSSSSTTKLASQAGAVLAGHTGVRACQSPACARAHATRESCQSCPPPPASRTDWTRLVPPSVLTRHVSSRAPVGQQGRQRGHGVTCTRQKASGDVSPGSSDTLPKRSGGARWVRRQAALPTCSCRAAHREVQRCKALAVRAAERRSPLGQVARRGGRVQATVTVTLSGNGGGSRV
jgi:hypothetical protein